MKDLKEITSEQRIDLLNAYREILHYPMLVKAGDADIQEIIQVTYQKWVREQIDELFGKKLDEKVLAVAPLTDQEITALRELLKRPQVKPGRTLVKPTKKLADEETPAEDEQSAGPEIEEEYTERPEHGDATIMGQSNITGLNKQILSKLFTE